MAVLDYKTKDFLNRNKEGALVGAVVGAIAAFYVRSAGLNFLGAASSPGLLDTLIAATPYDLAFYKMLIVYVFLGAIAGLLIDYFYKQLKR